MARMKKPNPRHERDVLDTILTYTAVGAGFTTDQGKAWIGEAMDRIANVDEVMRRVRAFLKEYRPAPPE